MFPTVIDLTHVIREGMAGHPSHGRTPVKLVGSLNHWQYRFTERFNPYDNSRISFTNEQWVLNGNTGTHMDAPYHADAESEISASEIPLEYGLGTGIWLDCSGVALPSGEILPADLERAEYKSGQTINAGDIVLVHTGWYKYFNDDPDKYLNEHPGLTKEAGEWLRERRVRTVGVDLPTVETVEGALTSPVHMNFLKPGSLGLDPSDFIGIIENLRNIDLISSPRFRFVGMPLPLQGSSASPIKAIAIPTS